MNFEYLLDERKTKQHCKSRPNESCYWIPTGNIRSMVGDNVNVSLFCKNCGRREELFLTSEQFKKQENLINLQLQKEEKRVYTRE